MAVKGMKKVIVLGAIIGGIVGPALLALLWACYYQLKGFHGYFVMFEMFCGLGAAIAGGLIAWYLIRQLRNGVVGRRFWLRAGLVGPCLGILASFLGPIGLYVILWIVGLLQGKPAPAGFLLRSFVGWFDIAMHMLRLSIPIGMACGLVIACVINADFGRHRT